MKKSALALLLIGVVFPILCIAQKTATVIAIQANIRKLPSTDADVVATVKEGAKLKLLSTEFISGWYNVSWGKAKGWIHGNNIEFTTANTNKSKRSAVNKWIYYAASRTESYYYNPAKTNRTGSNIKVWVKVVSDSTFDTTLMAQYELKCGSDQYRVLAAARYNNGASYGSVYRPERYFSPIVPDSVMESLYYKLCR